MRGIVPFNRNSGVKSFRNMIDDFFADDFLAPTRSLYTESFKLDVKEEEGKYIVEVDLPGVEKKDINLEMKDGRLTIQVHKDEKIEDEKDNYIHKERRTSSMQRSLYLVNTKDENVDAKLEDGVLTIEIPKMKEVDTSKKIEIK